jgi:hypothetical protein
MLYPALFLLAPLLISVVLLSSSIAAQPDGSLGGSSDGADYSHALCTAPIVDGDPASHYRGTWGPHEYFVARTLQRVCVYSNICLQLVEHAEGLGYTVRVKRFVPIPLSQEPATALPLHYHYLGFEMFSHGGTDFDIEVVHEAVPKHYAWATDAGVLSFFSRARL